VKVEPLRVALWCDEIVELFMLRTTVHPLTAVVPLLAIETVPQ
jgi:hypothetical protein